MTRSPGILLLVGALLSPAVGVPLGALYAAPVMQGQTADEQSQTKPDLALLQQIRKAIVDDKTLSMDGHNCKVITKGGMVRLRGPVDSEDEKTRIGAIATKIAGQDKVTNELTIKSLTSAHSEER